MIYFMLHDCLCYGKEIKYKKDREDYSRKSFRVKLAAKKFEKIRNSYTKHNKLHKIKLFYSRLI